MHSSSMVLNQKEPAYSSLVRYLPRNQEHQNQGPSLLQKKWEMERVKWRILWGQIGFTSSWIAQRDTLPSGSLCQQGGLSWLNWSCMHTFKTGSAEGWWRSSRSLFLASSSSLSPWIPAISPFLHTKLTSPNIPLQNDSALDRRSCWVSIWIRASCVEVFVCVTGLHRSSREKSGKRVKRREKPRKWPLPLPKVNPQANGGKKAFSNVFGDEVRGQGDSQNHQWKS